MHRLKGAPTMELQPGTVIEDRYEILEHIGGGGMGDVYRARELGLERNVAIKVILPSLLSDYENCNRFKLECKILSTLEHPNVLRFYRFGLWGGQMPYMAVELLDGGTILTELNRITCLPVSRLLPIARQICEGMQHAHRNGIVHRDLKPANIFLSNSLRTDGVKIVDFGLARLDNNAELQHLTQTGAIVGSLYYMSPEQCEGKKADARSDIYALGCLLYEAVRGSPPFTADSSVGLMYKHVNEPPEPLPLEVCGEVIPGGLQDVIFRAMAKKPEHRYQSMAEFGADLQLIQENRGGEVLPVVSPAGPVKTGRLSVAAVVALLCLCIPAVLCFINASTENGKASVARSDDTDTRVRVLPAKLPTWEDLPTYTRLRHKALHHWLARYGATDLTGAVRATCYIYRHFKDCGATRKQLDNQYICAQESFTRLLKAIDGGMTPDSESLSQALDSYLSVLREFAGGSAYSKAVESVWSGKLYRLLPGRYTSELAKHYANLLRDRGDFSREEKWRRRATVSRDPEELVLLSRCLIRCGKKQEAKRVLDQAVAHTYNSISASSVHIVAQELCAQGRAHEALEICDLCRVDYVRSLYISGQEKPVSVGVTVGCSSPWRHHLIVWRSLRLLGKMKEARQHLLSAADGLDLQNRWYILPTLVLSDGKELTAPVKAILEQLLKEPMPSEFRYDNGVLRAAVELVAVNPKVSEQLARKSEGFLNRFPPGIEPLIDQKLLVCRVYNLVSQPEAATKVCRKVLGEANRLNPESRERLWLVVQSEIAESLALQGLCREAHEVVKAVCATYPQGQMPDQAMARMAVCEALIFSREGKIEQACKVLENAIATLEVRDRRYLPFLYDACVGACCLAGDRTREAVARRRAHAFRGAAPDRDDRLMGLLLAPWSG